MVSDNAKCVMTPGSSVVEAFETGAVRDTSGDKPRLELISPVFVLWLDSETPARGYQGPPGYPLSAGVSADPQTAVKDWLQRAWIRLHQFRDTRALVHLREVSIYVALAILVDSGGRVPDEPLRVIPPTVWNRLGNWLRLGALRYTARNWEAGIPIDRSMASLLRHINQYLAGDRSEDHLAAALCNCQFIHHTWVMVDRKVLPASLNNLPDYYTPRKS